MIKKILIAMLLLISTMTLIARDFTLDECLEIAYENNLELEAKYIDLQKFEDKVDEAYSNVYPTIGLTSVTSMLLEPEKMTITMPEDEETGNMNAVMRQIDSYDYAFSHAIEISQVIFSAQAFMGIRIAKAQREVEKLNYDLLRRKIRNQIENAYYNILISKEVLALFTQVHGQNIAHLENIQAKFEQGVVSEFDKLRAEVKVETSSNDLEEKKLMYRNARLYMFLLLDMDYVEELAFTGEFGLPAPRQELSQAIDYANENRIELQILSQSKVVMDNVVDLYRADYLPTLFVNGQFGHTDASNSVGDFFAIGDMDKSYNINIGLKWNIFDGFSRESKINEARRDLKKLDIQTEQLKSGIETEIRQLYWALDKAEASYNSSLATIREAEKLLSIANIQYEEGLITFVELNDAQLAHQSVMLNHLNALYNYNTTLSNYENALGRN